MSSPAFLSNGVLSKWPSWRDLCLTSLTQRVNGRHGHGAIVQSGKRLIGLHHRLCVCVCVYSYALRLPRKKESDLKRRQEPMSFFSAADSFAGLQLRRHSAAEKSIQALNPFQGPQVVALSMKESIKALNHFQGPQVVALSMKESILFA